MAINTDLNEALLKDLLAIYTDAETQMLEKVAKRVKKGITDEGWNEDKLKDTQQLRKDIESLLNDKGKLAKTKIGQGILKAYKSGVNSAEKDAGKPLTAMQDLNVPLTIQNMLLTNYNLIDDGNSKILRNVNDAYRDVMAESATGLLSGVDTRVTASQKMMDKLAAKGITSFTDKAGRRWQMSTYTEMAMRTASAHAAIEGHIQTQESFGMDLMKVSSIGTTCPICARWQGVVLSISGKTPGYHTVDEARAAGLFHPNCKHTITMFDPEIDGEGQKELNSDAVVEKATARYGLLQQQRSNERAIRYWKRREAGAVDPKVKQAYKRRVNAAIAKNIAFCDAHNLRRVPQREGFKTGDPKKAYTVGVGQHLKEYTSLSPESVKALDDLGISITTSKTPKVAVSDILEKPAAGDSKGMMVAGLTDTEAYKKMFGTKPADDFKLAGGEDGTGMKYAKWLVTKVRATKTLPAVSPEDLKAEIKATSLTEVYKKYIGDKPMPTFKSLGGEEATGLSYAQWLKRQVDKISDPMASVMKHDSFESAPIKRIVETTKKLTEESTKARDKVYDAVTTKLIDEAKAEVDKLTSSKAASTLMKSATDEMKALKAKSSLTPTEEAKLAAVKEKLNMAKEKDVELLEATIKTASKDTAEFESKWLKDFAKRDGIDDEVKKHALRKAKMWDESIAEIEKREAEKRAAEEKRRREAEAKRREEERKKAEEAKRLAEERVRKLQEEQAKKPMILSDAEFDKLVAETGGEVFYRGISSASDDELRKRVSEAFSGEARVSGDKSSALGKGLYFAKSASEADEYAIRRQSETGDKSKEIFEATLKKGAKTVDGVDLSRAKLEEESELRSKIFDAMDKKDDELVATLRKEYDKLEAMDKGAYAKHKGYAAITDKRGTGYTVVVDQSKLVYKNSSYASYPRTASYLDTLDSFAEDFKNKRDGQSWRDAVSRLARDVGITDDEAQKKLDDAVKGLVEDSDFGSRIKLSNLNKVLDSRFKNLFEVGTGGGCTNMNMRAGGEEEVFGFTPKKFNNGSFPIEDRPFYGMCLPKTDGVAVSPSVARSYIESGPGSFYGDGTTVIYKKDRIINNTTVTVGDSLNESGYLVATNANNPKYTGGRLNIAKDVYKGVKPELTDHFSHGYLEIQIHGVDNHEIDIIDHVIFTKDYASRNPKDYSEVKAKLDAMGIPWENWATGEKSSN